MLYIDGADPCNATRMRNTAGGPTPRVNPALCSAPIYGLLDILWIVMVPLPAPSTAMIPSFRDDRAGSQQLIPQVIANCAYLLHKLPANSRNTWAIGDALSLLLVTAPPALLCRCVLFRRAPGQPECPGHCHWCCQKDPPCVR